MNKKGIFLVIIVFSLIRISASNVSVKAHPPKGMDIAYNFSFSIILPFISYQY